MSQEQSKWVENQAVKAPGSLEASQPFHSPQGGTVSGWHQKTEEEALTELKSDVRQGISEAEGQKRLREYGFNELQEGQARTPWQILWEQLTATMVLILFAAAAVSGLLGEWKDAGAITAIVALFALLGFVQEYRAEKALAALKRLAVPMVRVLREGEWKQKSARDLVPGDVIALEAGNLVPADGRILESASLRVQEAILTGESEPVEKITEALTKGDLQIGDRLNQVYMGTTVTFGRGVALVVQTGMTTELGQIASMLQSVKGGMSPLQKRLDDLGKRLALIGLAVSGLIFGLGLLRGEAVRDMLLTAVSIAVAIVPEGLPAVVTLTLALGAQRMLRRNALIRRLPAVETLGSVTVICSDKTGTLTENKMTVMVLDIAGREVTLTEPIRRHMPAMDLESRPDLLPVEDHSFRWLLAAGALCNDALLQLDPDQKGFHTIGDPTEGALLVAAARVGMKKSDLELALPRIAEFPFDSDRKRMSTVHQVATSLPGLELPSDGIFVFSKGSVDGLLDVSSKVWLDGQILEMNSEWRGRVQEANDRLARKGMRVLGVAFRELAAAPRASEIEGLEQDLIFIGLVGMIDPPRPEVKDAIAAAKGAGIRTVMITGDHPLTAQEIARELGITSGAKTLTGQELNQMSETELEAQVESVTVYARVSPEHKLRIVQALQKRGHVVSMTGDGVNDAPALKRADIGVAMGITGTDVSKEAAEMVLQDDNFTTIVAAIEEGRTIYDNLRKFIKYSVAGNIGKVLVMLLAPLLGKPLPILPLQLLWLNLLTDGLLGLGLGMEPPERGTMRRPPISPKEGIFSQGLGRHVLWVGMMIGALALGVGYLYWLRDPEGSWQTMTFTTLAFAQIGQSLASRSARESLWSLGLTSNPAGLGIAALTFFLQLAVIYVPFLQNFFRTEPLLLTDLLLCVAIGAIVFLAIEIEKWLLRQREA